MNALSATNPQVTTISPINSPRSDKARRNAERLLKKLDLKSSFPFDNNFVETSMGSMHFIDEGQGDPILMLHGNPTWSYLYRAFIAEFAGTHRVVAPDHIGFGLSEKPSDEGAYTIDQHIQNLETLVIALDLRNITLVVQDWGGPIGLGMASRLSNRVKRLVVLNTFGFYPVIDGMDPDNVKLPFPLRLMRTTGIGDFLVRRLGFFERVVMPSAVGKSAEYKKVSHAYTGVFETRDDRAGVMAFPRLIPTNTKHPSAKVLMNETAPFLKAFDGPALIFWGAKDPLFPIGALHAWKERLPQAKVTELPEAKHYIQEDAPDTLLAGIREFLG
jgi:pimeloyl-ACP methyl ester carboxylesterase